MTGSLFSLLSDYIAESPSTRDPQFLFDSIREKGLNYFRKIYSNEYCDREFFAGIEAYKPAYENLAAIIYEWAEPSTAYDIGCGNGYLIYLLNKLGVEISGCDKALEVLDFIDPILKDRIAILDLSAPQSLLKCDLCICTEVAEHVPKRFSDTFISNIANCARSHIFFSAAHPGQWGTGHINCQKQEYWIDIFSEKGWAYQPAPTYDVIQRVKKDANISGLLPWLADNVMLFTPISPK